MRIGTTSRRAPSACPAMLVGKRARALLPLMAERVPEDVQGPYMILVFLSWSLPLLLADIYLILVPHAAVWPGGVPPLKGKQKSR